MPILCYHEVDPSWASPLAVSPEIFAQHCNWLSRRRVVDLTTAVNDLGGSWSATGATAITFDDGFAGVYRHALPILERHRLPATVFVVAKTLLPGWGTVDWVDEPGGAAREVLSLEQLLEMQDRGVTIGSHSFAHMDLRTLTADECERDLRDSRELLEDSLRRPVRLLAYPRGRHNERVHRAALRGGFTHAFTLPETRERSNQYAIPRVGVYRDNGLAVLRVKAQRLYLPFRTSALFPVAMKLTRRRGGVPV